MQLDIEKRAGLVITITVSQPSPGARLMTYDDAADADANRAQQKSLLVALNAWDRASRREECGAWTIIGKQGSIHTWGDDGKSWALFVSCRSRQHWTSTKKRLAFCTVTQDCDDDGCLPLHELPTAEQAKVIRSILGIQKRREVSAAELERLRAFAFERKPRCEGTLEQNIGLGDRPVPDGRPGSEGNILPRAAPAAPAPVQRPKRPPWW